VEAAERRETDRCTSLKTICIGKVNLFLWTAEKLLGGSSSPMRSSKDGEELDQVVGNAEDEIGDRIAGVRETELLYGEESLLAVYGPMLVHICGSPHKFKVGTPCGWLSASLLKSLLLPKQNRTLRAAATLSFSKFLCVSSQFCEQHHRLLFKILETSKDASIRSNIVIALGDVAVSFSNIVDENSSDLYKGLSDQDLVVKKNTLMVLTHLILNGMIKVKGQLGEMAKCLEDPEPRIADLAKLFFTELSTKENAIYNNLPDGLFAYLMMRFCLLIAPSDSDKPLVDWRPCRRRGDLPKHNEVHLLIHREGTVILQSPGQM
jgi:condensin complex subunit 1